MTNALIVVDMLNDFNDDGALPVPGISNIIAPIQAKIAEYRNADKPVIFVADNHKTDDSEFNVFPVHCIDGTSGADVIASLDVNYSEIIPKTRFSGFFRTNLEASLLNTGIVPGKTVEVCGVCTSICIEATIAGLLYRDYNTIVDSNCVADLTSEAHTASLERMASLYGTNVLN